MSSRLDGDEDEKWRAAIFSKVCTFCINIDPDITKRACKAFPEGIPRDIWMGKNTHKSPYTGDHGIRFERINQGTK